MKYTAKDIEDAALICAIKTSALAASDYSLTMHATKALGLSLRVRRLAVTAHGATRGRMSDFARWAEAEALLRCGWLPPGATRARRSR